MNKKFTLCLILLSCFVPSFVGNAQEKSDGTPGIVKEDLDFSLREKKEVDFTPQRTVRKAKKNLKAEDFFGNFVWSGVNNLSGVYDANGGCMNIQLDPNNPGQVMINGFISYATVRGYVENDRLYIPNQIVRYNEYYNEDLWFWNVSIRNGNPSMGENKNSLYYQYNPSTPFFFILSDDGNLYAGESDNIDSEKWYAHEYTDAELEEIVCIPAVIRYNKFDEFYFLCQWIIGYPIDKYATVDDWNWEPIGEATFKDAWLPNQWASGQTPEYQVPLYRYKFDSNIFMLKNPYGPQTPYGENGITIDDGQEGHILFDISDPDLVCFYPFKYGCTLWGTDIPLYMYNSMGYLYYLIGYDKNELKEYATTPLSVFTKDTRVVHIEDAVYGYQDMGYVFYNYTWPDYDMKGYIILPDNYDSAVDAIEADETDRPVEYFNLQGVKLNNPEKGSLVIKRQGNKVSKMIAR